MNVQAYVFVTTGSPGAKRVVVHVRRVPGVLRADALFGAPDIMALIEGESIEQLDHVIDGIGALDGVVESETKIIRWV